MIRRDYILRMIEEFMQMLARLNSLKAGLRWDEAAAALDGEFQKLLNAGAEEATRLSETELLARVVQGVPTQVVRHRTFMLVTLLSEAGTVAAARGRRDEGRRYHLKALHLLLDVLGRSETLEYPEFVPKVESLVIALQDSPLPSRTHAMLMQHYERTGEFAKAEDALFALIESDPENGQLLEFGAAFYRRLLAKSDGALAEGNLPRPEIEQALKDLESRQARARP